MSGITGKSGVSYEKQNVLESSDNLQGVKDLVFAHKATAGATGISFGSLTTPTEMTTNGFIQPSAQEILSANLAYKKIDIVSSLNGPLMAYLTYTWTNSAITFKNGYTASEGEIFVITLNDRVSSGHNIVDARPIVATGVLLANDDEFVVGDLFKLNAYPSTQMGEVMVFVDGVIQFRNVGNATAAPAADGNYQEIEATGGYANIIKFNETEIYDRNIIVVSTNLIAERPNISMMQYIDTIATQLDSIIPTVANLAGVPESDFQALPNNVDLKVFGDRVKALESREWNKADFYEEINETVGSVSFTGGVEITNISTFKMFGTRLGKTITLGISLVLTTTGAGNGFDFITIDATQWSFLSPKLIDDIVGSMNTNINNTATDGVGTIYFAKASDTSFTLNIAGYIDNQTSRVCRGTMVIKLQ